jgi:U2 small nuclear ribonucleoprotein B''
MATECETLYVSNLNDRIKVSDLKALVYELFAGYGDVVSVQILRGKTSGTSNNLIRGTGFVSLRTVAQAATAMRNLNNFPFLGKPIVVQFAKKQSDEIAKIAGSYKPRFKPQRRTTVAKVE